MPVSRLQFTIAYLLFLVAGLGPLAIGIASFAPRMSSGTAGGVGFLVLLPLTLAGFAATIGGVIRTFKFGMPRLLVILSVLSMLYAGSFLMSDSDVLPVWLGNAVPLVLGIAIVAMAVYGLIISRKS
jgi:hypothetical protein